LVNIDHKAGISVLEDTLRENRGHPSLIACVARHAPDQLQDTAEMLLESPEKLEILSPLRRRFVRSKISK
ncbi:MAG: hypothetical protein OXE82_08585, partial [Rhodobacter sp.]|nr:hypothetical protein [Rhodobacter sp.]